PKERLGDYPQLLQLLRGRRERFILYVDDLSFEEQETHYKALKAILEGGIEARPDNVVLYATSNRRHLVRERFADRSPVEDDEVHVLDTMEEKLSLADRFGIRVTFTGPDQERYLAIVRAVAALPPRQRATVALRLCQDLPYAEIAQIMGCSEGTIKATMFAALRRLRAALAAEWRERS
ncbi:MAG: sigma-70 family RNA polymerase sigma factor, partial [Chloroflexi bacterium]|nr:sigma-70 family RNA polymerase sigma factor [Chloroflexota bacterium]